MTEKTGKSQITFIGTGAMGKPMVRELMKSGYSVKVNDKHKKTGTWPVFLCPEKMDQLFWITIFGNLAA